MHMLDNENILFAAGNIVQILNMKLNKTEYIRSSGGGGIGAVAVSYIKVISSQEVALINIE